jgi:hypothetical protein
MYRYKATKGWFGTAGPGAQLNDNHWHLAFSECTDISPEPIVVALILKNDHL